jgi:transposase-like protein
MAIAPIISLVSGALIIPSIVPFVSAFLIVPRTAIHSRMVLLIFLYLFSAKEFFTQPILQPYLYFLITIMMMKITRNSYSAKFKVEVIRFSHLYSIKEACGRFKVDPSMVSRWKSKLNDLSSAIKTCRRVGNSGRRVSFPEQESVLYNWIVEERSLDHLLSRDDIRDKMIELVIKHSDLNNFKASNSWLSGFIKRFNLSSRVVTGHQSRSLSADVIKERISSFHEFLDKHSPSSTSIINMDQTPVWLNIGCTGKTIHQKGAKEVLG